MSLLNYGTSRAKALCSHPGYEARRCQNLRPHPSELPLTVSASTLGVDHTGHVPRHHPVRCDDFPASPAPMFMGLSGEVSSGGTLAGLGGSLCHSETSEVMAHTGVQCSGPRPTLGPGSSPGSQNTVRHRPSPLGECGAQLKQPAQG